MSRFKYNTDIFQFKKHIDNHRDRVIRLAIHIAMNNYYVINSYKIWALHDIEKYLFLPWLWSYYGDRRNRAKARKLYDRMNKVGELIRLIAYWYYDIPKDKRSLIEKTERIADIVDRHCHEATLEEFGLSQQRPLSDFLTGEDLLIAEQLKSHYNKLFKRGKYDK